VEDGVIVTCPVCRGALALGDRNGRHVASEAHFPHPDAGGTMRCSPPTRGDWLALSVDAGGLRRTGGGSPDRDSSRRNLRIVT
jgi:hypothetical protein